MGKRANSEQEILEKLGEGDRNDFDEIYNKHWEQLFQMAYKILQDREAAEDY